MVQIKDKITGAIISEGITIKEAAENAENLSDAYLFGADLRGACLSDADLRFAYLCGADLSGADLSGVDLNGAGLRGANLRGVDLSSSDLSGTDLRDADLSGAYLWNSAGNMWEVKSLRVDTYAITYTADRLQIGDENHAISEWWEFDDETIDTMDTGALDWWRVWKPILKQIIEASPATPTGKEA